MEVKLVIAVGWAVGLLCCGADAADLTPAAMLDNFCPCLPRAACSAVLGGDGGLQGLLEAIPACPGRRIRCCTQDRMFNAITQIMNLFGPQPPSRPAAAAPPPPGAVQVQAASRQDTSGRLFPDPLANADDDYYADDEEGRQDNGGSNGNGGNGETTTAATDTTTVGVTAPPGSSQVVTSTVGSSSVPGLVCVPVATCPVPNIYGTRPAHFLRFGFVSPSAVQCDATAGQILCVQEPAAGTTTAGDITTEATTTTTEAETTAGTATTTTEAAATTEATTAAVAGSPPPPTVQVLDCRRVADCAVVFGTRGEHFAQFGEQAACANGLVRCVTARGAAAEETTTTVPVTPPVFTPGLPVGPVAPSVSIIGPQPIYVSYNNIVGPRVGSCCSGGGSGTNGGDGSPGTVSSAGASPAQEQQINSLLQNLRSRLQSIITSVRS